MASGGIPDVARTTTIGELRHALATFVNDPVVGVHLHLAARGAPVEATTPWPDGMTVEEADLFTKREQLAVTLREREPPARTPDELRPWRRSAAVQ